MLDRLEKLEKLKNKLRKSNRAIRNKEFSELRQMEKITSFLKCEEEQKNRSSDLLQKFLAHPDNSYHERIILGAGVAATAIYAELPNNQREATYDNQLPNILVLNDPDNPNQWKKDLIDGNIVMAREAEVQTPQMFSIRPYDYSESISTDRNPYHYVMTNDFEIAQRETQNDLKMSILNLKVIRIESLHQVPIIGNWEYLTYAHRVVVLINNRERFLYTNHIDVCMGLGLSRKLSNEQISPSLSEKLQYENKLVYGQDKGNAKLKGKIIFYGGSARNATMISDLVLAKASVDITWVSRSENDFNQTKKLSRLYADLSEKYSHQIQMALGSLDRVEQLANGEIRLWFLEPKNKISQNTHLDLTNKYIDCDHLIVGIGQQPNPLIENLRNFVPCVYNDQFKAIPLGTTSVDKSILVWGAAGSTGIGLSASEKLMFNASLTEHTDTLPLENQSNGNVYFSTWTIKKMITELRKEKKFPANPGSPYQFDLPEINLATHGELLNLVTNSNLGISKTEAKILADEIIKIRKQNPRGIESVADLSKIIPDKYIGFFANSFFPFQIISAKNKIRKIDIHHFNGVLFKQKIKQSEPKDLFPKRGLII